MIQSSNILTDLFESYQDNINQVDPKRGGDGTIPCPLCLAPMTIDGLSGAQASLEHIIPQHSTRESAQPSRLTKVGTKNARSGLTITCEKCNREKGRTLDWALRNRITPGKRSGDAYGFRSGVAILTYAYLLAFAHFGYEYILRDDLNEIRRQFSDPDTRQSAWLEHAVVDLLGAPAPIVCSEQGYPCVFRLHPPPLQVMFWRFVALLPPLGELKSAVRIPSSVLRLAEQANREVMDSGA